MRADMLFTGGAIATMLPNGTPYGLIEDASLAIGGGRILWAGPRCNLPRDLVAATIHDFAGQLITPGLIDCHTHLVFAGERSAEFEARLERPRALPLDPVVRSTLSSDGESPPGPAFLRGPGSGGGPAPQSSRSYEAAAKSGGGILSTMVDTRAATPETLSTTASNRLARLVADGVTTVEIKSGYGLSRESELKMLRVARALAACHGVHIRTTLLAAHATPPEFAGRPDAYIDHIIHDILPAAMAENLVDAVDAFAERIAFSAAQVNRLFDAAGRAGLPVKLHADQLSDGGGAALAASHRALSADHLEYTSEAGVRAMAAAGTVAVLLPGAYATVGATQPPPIKAFRAHGVGMAVATDCNPGSSPLCSLLMAMNFACALFRLTPEEALAGVTRHAAAALGLSAEAGVIAAGRRGDLLVWPIQHPRELAYWMGGLTPVSRVVNGILY